MTARKRTSAAANSRKRSRDDDDGENKKTSATTTNSNSANKNKLSSTMTQSQQMTAYGAVVLVVSIVAGMLWNSTLDDAAVDPSIQAFWRAVCQTASCGRMISPTRRTLRAVRPVRPGEAVVEIPRSLQIWELDALRSDPVRTENLLAARHDLTKNALAGGAYMAAHLVMEQKRLSGSTNHSIDDMGYNETGLSQDSDQVMASYLQSLPPLEDLKETHPIFMSRAELRTLLGHHSWNFAVVVMYQEMVESEYAALSAASAMFASRISKDEYKTSRVHVLTRSFNPGPQACLSSQEGLTKEEQEDIETRWGMAKGTLFAEGCHAMVPILDMLNHHPQPNVVYKFDIDKLAFVISAKDKIPVKWELMDSYGMYTDAHLFAKFGFVNGDGSGFTQASIAVFHRPLDVQIKNEFTLVPNAAEDHNVKKKSEGGDDEEEDGIFSLVEDSMRSKMKIPDFQKPELKRYLQYDDGYAECVQKDKHPYKFELKQLKWYHLSKIANDPKSWTAVLSPRSPLSKPAASSELLITEQPPQIDPRNLGVDVTRLVETCRLLALTTDDYDGKAVQVLKDNMFNDTFVVQGGSPALEYRALMFLGRLASTALLQYNISPKDEYDRVVQLNKENAFPAKNWTAAQLRLGEMQSLHAISGIAFSNAKRWEVEAKKEKESGTFFFKMREKSCPKEYTDVIDEEGLFD
jgi:hypothetical protein